MRCSSHRSGRTCTAVRFPVPGTSTSFHRLSGSQSQAATVLRRSAQLSDPAALRQLGGDRAAADSCVPTAPIWRFVRAYNRTQHLARWRARVNLPDLGEWPRLDWEQWKGTAETLHMCMQVVGKTRLALTPLQNHWWNTSFYLSARGLTTSAMPTGKGLLDVEFDFVSHEVVCRTSGGQIGKIALRAVPVAQFFQEFFDTLKSLAIAVKINPTPVEVANPVRCDVDTVHCSYDRDAVVRFWHALRIADTLLKRFSTNFYGKISPVHFFWGSFDLAVTRFSGRRAPARPGVDSVQAEAYSHEVISAGFWPGNGGYGRAAFYAYAAPTPDGLSQVRLRGRGAFNQQMGEFL